MADFSADTYFSKRAQDDGAAPMTPVVDTSDAPRAPQLGVWGNTPDEQSKYDSLQAAAEDKAGWLERMSVKREQLRVRNERSIVSRKGLDPNSTEGQFYNAIGGGAANVGAVLGHLTGGVNTILGGIRGGGISDAEKLADERERNGQATPEDLALLNSSDSIIKGKTGGPTKRDRIKAYRQDMDSADMMVDLTNWDHLKHEDQTEPFAKDINWGFEENLANVDQGTALREKGGIGNVLQGSLEQAKGWAGLVVSVGKAAIDNPAAVAQHLAENSINLALAAAGKAPMTASNALYALDTYRAGIRAYRKEHGDSLPSKDKQLEMATLAFTNMAAEMAGDYLTFGGAKAVKGIAKEAEAVKSAAKRALLEAGKSAGRVAERTASGAVGEYGTELYQTWSEEKIKGKDETLAKMHLGGAIGAVTGGTTAGGIATLGEAAKGAGALADKLTAEAPDSTSKLQAQATVTGDVSALLDPAKPTFAPHVAITSLQANANLAATPNEKKEANLTQANQIVADLESQREKLTTQLAEIDPVEVQKELEKAQAVLAQVDPADTEAVAGIQSGIDFFTQQLADMAADPKPAESAKAGLTVARNKLDKQLELAKVAMGRYTAEEEIRKADVPSMLKQISMSVEQATAAAQQSVDGMVAESEESVVDQLGKVADKLIRHAMMVPESLSAAEATKLADDTTNALTGPQRTAFRAMGKARVAENLLQSIGGTSAEIYTGGKNTGIAEHRANMVQALNTGNDKAAQTTLREITNFAEDHNAKAATLAAAWKQFNQTGVPVEVLSDGNRGWKITPDGVKHKTVEERQTNAGVLVGVKSKKLITNVKSEAEALTAAAAELDALYRVNPARPTKESNVPLPPTAPAPANEVKARSPAPAVAQAPAAAAPVAAGTSTTANGTATAAPTNEARITKEVVYQTTARKDDGRQLLTPQELDDILAELEADAQEGKLTPARFKQAKFSKLLGPVLEDAVIKGIVADPVGMIKAIRAKLGVKKESKGSAPAPVAATSAAPTAAPGPKPGVVERIKVKLSGSKKKGDKNLYLKKDQAKSDKANKFIGRGSAESSTARYLLDWQTQAPGMANSGKYSKTDVVFVSAEGQRKGRIAPDFKELTLAIKAGATIITDIQKTRDTKYNLGEKQVAAHLTKLGYVEKAPGMWTGKHGKIQVLNAPAAPAAPSAPAEKTLADKHPYMYHGTRVGDELLIQADGSLLLKPAKNFGGKTNGVSFTHDLASASDYAARIKGGGPTGFSFKKARVIRIDTSKLPNLTEETSNEWADYTGEPIVIPKGSFTITPVARSRFYLRDSHLEKDFFDWKDDNYSAMERETVGDEAIELFLDELIDSAEEFERSPEDVAEAKAILRDQFGRDYPQSPSGTSVDTVSSAEAESTEGAKSAQKPAGQLNDTQNITVTGVTPVTPTVTQSPEVTSRAEAPTSGDVVDTSPVVVEPQVDMGPVQPGNLGIYSDKDAKASKDKPYPERNLLVAHTTQTKDNPQTSKPRPLVAVKDFVSQLINGTVRAVDYVLDGKMSNQQLNMIKAFAFTARRWRPSITESLFVIKDGRYLHTDMIQFLYLKANEDGKVTTMAELEENVKSAIALAAVQYLLEQAAHGAKSDADLINELLDREKEHPISPEEWKFFEVRMNYEHNARNNMGKMARQALGIKPTDTAQLDLMTRFDGSLGAHVQKIMLEEGWLVRESATQAQMAIFRGHTTGTNIEYEKGEDGQPLKDDEGNPIALVKYKKDLDGNPLIDEKTGEKVVASQGPPANFLQLNWDQKKKVNKGQPFLPKTATELIKKNRGTQEILTTLFDMETSYLDPSLTPIPFKQESPEHTNQKVPSRLQKAAEKNQATKNFAHADKHKLLTQQMSDERRERMFGVVAENDAAVHISNRAKVSATNDGLRREWDRYAAFTGNVLMGQAAGLLTPFFLKYSVWQNQRVGIDTNGINPQMSKMHRYLIYKQQWETRIDPTDAKSFNNFKVLVATGLGVKSDKQSNKKTLAAYTELFNETSKDADTAAKAKLLNKAVAALQVSLRPDSVLSEEQQEDIALGVEAGGENLHSLDVLIGMAHMRNADGGSFVVQMMAEVDGVNNGPMLSFLLYGAANTVEEMFARLNRGGMYRKGAKHSQYGQWREDAGNTDLYESTIAGIMAYVNWIRTAAKSKKKEELNPLFDAIFHFTGDFATKEWAKGKDGKWLAPTFKATKAGRQVIKEPITAIHFGSSTKSSAESMAHAFFADYYATIEAAAQGPAEGQGPAAAVIIEKINTLITDGKQPGPPIEEGLTIAQLMELELRPDQITAIYASYMKSMGEATQFKMKEDFGHFLAQRDTFNDTAQLMFEMTQAIYLGERAKYIKELLAQNKIEPYKKTGKPSHDLTIEQEKALRERLRNLTPLFHSIMSLEDQDLDAGLLMAKPNKAIASKDNQAYAGVTKFSTGIKGLKWEKQTSLLTRGFVTGLKSPSVGMTAKAIHSFDSAASHAIQLMFDVLNNHDGIGTGLNNFTDVAEAMNKNLYSELMAYSPVREMYNVLARQTETFGKMLKAGEINDAAMQNIAGAMMVFAAKYDNKKSNKDKPPLTMLGMLEQMAEMAYEADYMKFSTMAEMAYMDQYGLEGGNYKVTDANRAEALKQRDLLSEEIPEHLIKHAERIDKWIASYQKSGKVEGVKSTTEVGGLFDNERDVNDITIDEHLEIDLAEAKQLTGYYRQAPELSDEQKALMTAVHESLMAGTTKTLDAALDALNDPVKQADLTSFLLAKYKDNSANLFGGKGASTSPTDPALVDAMKAKPVMTGKAALALAVNAMKADPDVSPEMKTFYESLIARIGLLMPAKLTVTYVTENTRPHTVEGESAHDPMTGARGWFMPSRDGHVYVLGSEFKYSGLTWDVLVHEILHSVTSEIITNPTGEAVELVKALEGLRTEAQSWLNEQPSPRLKTAYAPALANIHELVSWGLSHRGFQTEVLNQITVKEDTTRNNPLRANTLMKKFINLITNLFFGVKRTSNALRTNGMAILIANASGIFEAQAQRGIKAAGTGGTRLPNRAAEEMHAELGNEGFSAVHSSPTHHAGVFDWRRWLLSGERAMVFGAGTYLSTAEGVYQHYKTKFSDMLGSKALKPALKQYQDNLKLLKATQEFMDPSMWTKSTVLRPGKGGAIEKMTFLFPTRQTREFSKDKDGNWIEDGESSSDTVYDNGEWITNPHTTQHQSFEAKLKASFGFRLKTIQARVDKEGAEIDALVAKSKKYYKGDTTAPTYMLSVNIKPHEMLDWDKPLTEQHPEVQKKLTAAGVGKAREQGPLDWAMQDSAMMAEDVNGNNYEVMDEGSGFTLYIDGDYNSEHETEAEAQAVAQQLADTFSENITGESIYRRLSDDKAAELQAEDPKTQVTETDADRAASEFLQSIGIVGHRFKAGGGVNDTHPNYVVYDDTRIKTNAVMFSKNDKGYINAVTFKGYGIVAINEQATDNFTDAQLEALLLHEIGVHYGMEKMIGKEAFQNLLVRLRSEKGKSRAVDAAYAAVPKDTPAEHVDEEALAYLVEHHANTPIGQDLIARVAKWIKEKMGALSSKGMTIEQQATVLAKAALTMYRDEVQIVVVDNISMTPKDDFVKVDFETALKKAPEMHRILDLVNFKLGNKTAFTGSLAMAPILDIYRHKDEQVHDLDFQYFGNMNDLKRDVARNFPEATLYNQIPASKKLGEMITMAFPMPGVVIQSIQAVWVPDPKKPGKEKVIKVVYGSVDGKPTQVLEKYHWNPIDFFVADPREKATTRTHEYKMLNGATRSMQLVNPHRTFKAKFGMAREKDIRDAVLAGKEIGGQFMSESGAASGAPMAAEQEDRRLRMMAATVNEYSTLDIHTALGQYEPGAITPAFDEHLRDVLGSIVEKLHGAKGVLAADRMAGDATVLGSPLTVWAKAKQDKVVPFASRVIGHLGVSNQVAHAIEQIEATMRAALGANERNTTDAYQQLAELYQEAKGRLKPSDFKDPATYAFIFTAERIPGTDRSDYLSRFAAMGLALPELNELLNFPSDAVEKTLGEITSIPKKIQRIFEMILDFFAAKAANTFRGQPADDKLKSLVNTLVDIEIKQKALIMAKMSADTTWVETAENKTKELIDAAKDKIMEATESNVVKNSKSLTVQVARRGTQLVVGEQRLERLLENISRLHDKSVKGANGIPGSLLYELRGALEAHQLLLREGKHKEGERKKHITNTANQALAEYIDEGKGLDKDDKAAITSAFLRSGAHVLLNDYAFDMNEIHDLLTDPVHRAAAIRKYEAKLAGFTPAQRAFYSAQANGLGYMTATGLSLQNEAQLLNAHNIARLAATTEIGTIPEDKANQAEKAIEVLIALYALEHQTPIHREHAAKVLAAENQRPGRKNGVEFTLKRHKQLEAEALAKLFDGNKTQMQHGYTPEVTDPHVDVKTADNIDGEELEYLGYSKGAAIPNDPADPDQAIRHIYILRGAGLQPQLTGALSYTGLSVKGSTAHNGFLDPRFAQGVANQAVLDSINRAKVKGIRTSFVPQPHPDLTQRQGTLMVPVLNDAGEKVNWRYLMAHSTRDNLLQRNNSFETMLGAISGSTYDKVESPKQNRVVIQALKDEYEIHGKAEAESYVEIGPRSKDPYLREKWDMLPDATKEAVREVWGEDKLKVRSDSLNIIFGYRKWSASTMFGTRMAENAKFKKDMEEGNKISDSTLNFVQRFTTDSMEFMYTVYAQTFLRKDRVQARNWAKRAGSDVARLERMNQEIVKAVKDIIVVKSMMLNVANVISNAGFLHIAGVSKADILKDHSVAFKGVTAYMQDSTELYKYESMLASGYLGDETVEEIEQKIIELQDAISKNSVKSMIDAGMMPTIVEDIAADEDVYAYKSNMIRWMEGKTKWATPNMKKYANWAVMSHDTDAYKTLARFTQVSDFVARYTLYNHVTTRKVDPMAPAEALQYVSESFIQYDIPMHQKLQYMDDMGFMMFTKYFLRIQKPLLRLVKDKPGRVLMATLLHNLMDLGPNVLEGSLFHKVGNNPLSSGGLQIFSAWKELAWVSGLMALLPSAAAGGGAAAAATAAVGVQ